MAAADGILNKIENEVQAMDPRPNPWEFNLCYDI
jgi:hypothetical protein